MNLAVQIGSQWIRISAGSPAEALRKLTDAAEGLLTPDELAQLLSRFLDAIGELAERREASRQ